MEGTEIALRVVGAFYAFAGLVAARAALTSNLIDRAISAISMQEPERIETFRTYWLVSLSVLIFAGGVGLMLLLEPAAWIFAVATLVQAVYFALLGPYYFDVADPPDPAGRRRSLNAFVIYGAATAFAVWSAYTGRLIPIASAPGWLLGAAAGAVALHVGYIARHMFPAKRKSFGFGDGEDTPVATFGDDIDLDLTGLPSSSKRIKVMADYGMFPLWAMDDGLVGNFAPQDLGVSENLVADLWIWASEFDMSFNADDPASSHWPESRFRDHTMQGVALARRIKRELPDREVFVHDHTGTLIEVDGEDAAKL